MAKKAAAALRIPRTVATPRTVVDTLDEVVEIFRQELAVAVPEDAADATEVSEARSAALVHNANVERSIGRARERLESKLTRYWK